MSETTTTTTTPEIIVSFEDVRMKDFRAYWQAVGRNDWQGQDAFFAKVVKQWPFVGDPSDAEAYGELSVEEYATVQGAINEKSAHLTTILRTLNTRGNNEKVG